MEDIESITNRELTINKLTEDIHQCMTHLDFLLETMHANNATFDNIRRKLELARAVEEVLAEKGKTIPEVDGVPFAETARGVILSLCEESKQTGIMSYLAEKGITDVKDLTKVFIHLHQYKQALEEANDKLKWVRESIEDLDNCDTDECDPDDCVEDDYYND